MPSLSLYVDVQARQLVTGFTNPAPATLPAVNISDTLSTTIYFLNQTGVSSAPYTYANLSASAVKELLGIIAGIPTYGTFCLTDGATTSGTIPYNDNASDVQSQILSVTSWTTPIVTGGIGGPWTITNGVNGALPVLTSTLNELAPSCAVIITQQSAGSPTSPAVNIVRLALNPIAEQTTFTNAGSPTYAFSGSLSPNPVALQQLMGTLLSMAFSFQIETVTSGDTETYINTAITLQNTLLPTGASYTPTSTPSGSYVPAYTSIATLQAIPTAGGAIQITQIVPGLVGGGTVNFQLRADNTGILPNDYSASTNLVSWHQVL